MAAKKKETTKKKVYDLANFDLTVLANEGAEIELKHPVNGEGIGSFISIIGTDSDTYQSAIAALRNKRIEAAKNAKTVNMTAEDIDEQNIDLLAACTTGFRDLILDGETVVFSVANAKKIYTRFKWIRDQIDNEIGDRSNFLK